MAREKGLSIEELRKTLESDATKQLAELKANNENLEAGNKFLKKLGGEQLATILEQKQIIDQLSNRCYALTSFGSLCVYCGIRNECSNSPANRFMKKVMGG